MKWILLLASELLMPTKYFKMMVAKYAVDGKVNRDGILKIAGIFGTRKEMGISDKDDKPLKQNMFKVV